MKDNIEIIFRSVGERTEKLALEAIRRHKEPIILKNIIPASEMVKEMFNVMCKHPNKWFIAVDADLILKEDWLKAIKEIVKKNIKSECIVPTTLDYIQNSTCHRGSRMYNTKFAKQLYNVVANKDFSKHVVLEREITIRGGCKHVLSHTVIGYHGFEQFYRDIYNTHIRIGYSNPPHGKRILATIKNPNTAYKIAAYEGLLLGLNGKQIVKDTREYMPYTLAEERGCCTLTLDEFYKKYRRSN